MDQDYRDRLEVADGHHLPLSEFNDWAADDLGHALGLKQFRDESCGGCGIHPSVVKPELGGSRDAVVAVWKHCLVCERIAQAEAAGPPTEDKGWHLTLQHNY